MNQAKKEIQKYKKEEEKLTSRKIQIEAEIDLDQKKYNEKIQELKKEYQKEMYVQSGFDGTIDSTRKNSIDQSFQSRLNEINQNDDFVKKNYELKSIEEQLKKNSQEQQKWNQKISETEKMLNNKDNTKNLSETGNKITDIIKRVGKWTLAVFAVESAYGLVRSAISTLSGYNKQLSTDIEYIQFAIASILEPIIERIVSWVFTLLQYVNYLAQAWFNVNLFANASEKNFKSANQSAKQLNKTLAGFDEINQLQDTSQSDSSASLSPSVDLSNTEEFQPPAWLAGIATFFKPVVDFFKEIIDKYGLVAGGIMIVVGAIAGFRILKSIGNLFTNFGKSVKGVSVDFTDFFKSLGKAAEALAVLGGLSLVIDSITNLIDTFSESGMTLGEVAGLLGIVLGEVAGAFIVLLGAMTLLQPSWQSIAGAAVVFVGMALTLESICDLLETFSESGLELTDVIGLMTTVVLTIVGLMGAIVLLGPAMTAGLVPFSILIAEISAVLIVLSLTLPVILDAVGEFIKTSAPALCSLLEAIGNLINSVLNSIVNFINKLGPAINSFVDNVISAVTKLVNFMISAIEYLVNTLIVDGINSIINGINSISKYVGITIPTLGEFKIARFQPTYMATGGIIDVPRRGVPLASNVIGGEAGAEGVLPLTDESTMRRLGQEIGKWIVLNIDLTGKIDKRILFKEFLKWQDEQNFSRNGGI